MTIGLAKIIDWYIKKEKLFWWVFKMKEREQKDYDDAGEVLKVIKNFSKKEEEGLDKYYELSKRTLEEVIHLTEYEDSKFFHNPTCDNYDVYVRSHRFWLCGL